MDGTLKFLIGTACVVVIAAGGYYGWSEYKAHQSLEIKRQTALMNARARQAKAEQEQRLTQAECIRMAKETLPENNGGPVRTTKYNDDLSACDDLNRFDPTWRRALDMAGVF